MFAIILFSIFEVCAMEGASVQCGSTNFLSDRISKGTTAARDEWPFLTALFLAEQNLFFCGGNLVSAKHVLTGIQSMYAFFAAEINKTKISAAHCIRDKGSESELLRTDIIVLLGAYDLTSRFERGVKQRDVEEIHVHPDWREYSDKYDADLAILVLSEIVSFTNFVRPVCLPDHDIVFDDVTGTVAGWGFTESKSVPNKEFVEQASVTAINAVYCLTEHPIVAILSSTRTFCGRGENGNANRGDSGGGFYVFVGSSWMQYGIVSSLRSNETGFVDADTIVVYTNVLKFIDWIRGIVGQAGFTVSATVGVAKTRIDLECRFAYYGVSDR